MVTFECRIESKGKVEGVMGDLFENMLRDLSSEESEKDRSFLGL